MRASCDARRPDRLLRRRTRRRLIPLDRADRRRTRSSTDLDQVFPGAAAAASRAIDGPRSSRTSSTGRRIRSRLGSYTCYRPGQFTTHRRPRGPAGRQPVLRRRARQLVLRAGRASWKARRFRASMRPRRFSRCRSEAGRWRKPGQRDRRCQPRPTETATDGTYWRSTVTVGTRYRPFDGGSEYEYVSRWTL